MPGASQPVGGLKIVFGLAKGSKLSTSLKDGIGDCEAGAMVILRDRLINEELF